MTAIGIGLLIPFSIAVAAVFSGIELSPTIPSDHPTVHPLVLAWIVLRLMQAFVFERFNKDEVSAKRSGTRDSRNERLWNGALAIGSLGVIASGRCRLLAEFERHLIGATSEGRTSRKAAGVDPATGLVCSVSCPRQMRRSLEGSVLTRAGRIVVAGPNRRARPGRLRFLSETNRGGPNGMISRRT